MNKGKHRAEGDSSVTRQQASGLPGPETVAARGTAKNVATVNEQFNFSEQFHGLPQSASFHWPSATGVNQFERPESLAAFLQQSQHALPLQHQEQEYPTFGPKIKQDRHQSSSGSSRKSMQVSQSIPEMINTSPPMHTGPVMRGVIMSRSDETFSRLPSTAMTAAEYLAYHEPPDEAVNVSSGSMAEISPPFPASTGQFDEASLFGMASPTRSSLPHQSQPTTWFPASSSLYPRQPTIASPSSYYGRPSPFSPPNAFLSPMAAFPPEYTDQSFVASSSSLPPSTLPTSAFPSSSSPASSSTMAPPPNFPPSTSPIQSPSTAVGSSAHRVRIDEAREAIPACDLCRKRKVKCDRQRPTCGFCARQNVRCTTEDQLRKRGPPTRAQKIEMKEAGFIYDRSKRRWIRVTDGDEMLDLDSTTEETDSQAPPKQKARQGSLPNKSSHPSIPPILKHSKSDTG